MTKIVHTVSRTATAERQQSPTEFTHDLGNVKVGETKEFVIDVGKQTQEGKVPASCWCTAATAAGSKVSVTMFCRGTAGKKETRTLNGFYEDKTRYQIQIQYQL